MATRSIYIDPRTAIVPALVTHLNDGTKKSGEETEALGKVHFADYYKRKFELPAEKDLYALVNGHGRGEGGVWRCQLQIDFYELVAERGDADAGVAGPPVGLEIGLDIDDRRPSLALQNILTWYTTIKTAVNAPLTNYSIDFRAEPAEWGYDDEGSDQPGVEMVQYVVWTWEGNYDFTG